MARASGRRWSPRVCQSHDSNNTQHGGVTHSGVRTHSGVGHAPRAATPRSTLLAAVAALLALCLAAQVPVATAAAGVVPAGCVLASSEITSCTGFTGVYLDLRALPISSVSSGAFAGLTSVTTVYVPCVSCVHSASANRKPCPVLVPPLPAVLRPAARRAAPHTPCGAMPFAVCLGSSALQ